MNKTTLLHIKKCLQERLVHSTSEVDDLETAVALSEIEGELAKKTHYWVNCKGCNQQKHERIELKSSLPENLCSACFTSNA